MKVYVVWTRPQCLDAEEPSLCVGIYSSREAALGTVQGLMGDEWNIREHGLDTVDPGQTIWTYDCYHERAERRATMRSFFRMHWPNGFPD